MFQTTIPSFKANLNKSLVGLHHYVVGHGNEVAADEDYTVAPLVVAIGVGALLTPPAALVDSPIAANQEAVSDVIIIRSLLILFRKLSRFVTITVLKALKVVACAQI